MRRSRQTERGSALIASYLVVASMLTLTALTYQRALTEIWAVNRETARVQSLCAAEAGLQSALAQIAQDAYTGFIDTDDIDIPEFQQADGEALGSVTVEMEYPSEADWVIVTSTATVNGDTRVLEGRVFLESNLSKHLVYADTSNFASGTNAQYGEHDGVNPEGVPANENARASMYFTGDYTVSGNNVQVYGDVNAEEVIHVSGSGDVVHGDTYVSTFEQDDDGNVTDDGVSGSMEVDDGFSDDSDRNGDSVVNSTDAPDRHDLTESGSGDAHALDPLQEIDLEFYEANNDVPTFDGASPQNRYLRFEAAGGYTRIREYSSSSYTTQTATYDLPEDAIVYVNGDAYVRGAIEGRVSVVASDDIMLQEDVTYEGGQTTADADHSVALMARDQMFFRDNNLTVSGILYGENVNGNRVVFDANYNTAGRYAPGQKRTLYLYGNRVMQGSTNLSNYPTRVYNYDEMLRYYRPPGIPVVPELRMVREIEGGGA